MDASDDRQETNVLLKVQRIVVLLSPILLTDSTCHNTVRGYDRAVVIVQLVK